MTCPKCGALPEETCKYVNTAECVRLQTPEKETK